VGQLLRHLLFHFSHDGDDDNDDFDDDDDDGMLLLLLLLLLLLQCNRVLPNAKKSNFVALPLRISIFNFRLS
jgi:hypothetical protein